MAQNITGLTGTVGDVVKPGTMVEGRVLSIATGRADEFMTPDQCAARKTPVDTRYINVEVAIGEYGIRNKSFPDYSNPDDETIPINPNSIHGRLLATYPELTVEGTVNMIAAKKTTQNGELIVWDMVLV